MKNYILITALASLLTLTSFAQESSPSFFKSPSNNFDLSIGSKGDAHLFALAWNHLHAITKNKKLKIGYGLRFNSNIGKGDFTTAPADLTSDEKNLDTISVSSYHINSLNASIHINYAISSKLELEFNIDAVGLSFGGNVNADYNSIKRLGTNPLAATKQSAKPTGFNLLLVGDNDLGSLNSEFKIKYYFKPKWSVNVGATFIFAEYTTSNKLFKENDRFRQKTFVPMIGITYSPFRGN
jgi:hypothetical protein